MSIVAIDPYGNRVVIPGSLIPDTLSNVDLLETIDKPDKVVAKPAMMLTTCEGPVECCTGPCINHYFRLISHDDTLLISAQKKGKDWAAFSCIRNPSNEQLSGIFQNARTL